MARIVYITNGMASTLNSGFEMCRQLVDAGHQVTWLCNETTADRVRARGFEAHSLESASQIVEESLAINARFPTRKRNPGQLLKWIAARRELRRRSIRNPEIEQAIRELAADLLLIDYEMHFAIIASAKLGIPTILPIVWFSIFRHPNLPLMHTKRRPPTTFSERLANQTGWSAFHIRRWFGQLLERVGPGAIRNALRPAGLETNRRHDLLAIARANHFRLRSETSRRHWIKPHAYKHLPVLCYNVSEMDFPHQPHPHLNYVGPMIDRQRSDNLFDPESMGRWKQFCERRQAQPSHRPLIYCSLGTFMSADQQFLNRVIEAFRNRNDWQLVIGLGGNSSQHRFQDESLPENVLILDYAPQLEVIRHADVAITHGGITSINEYVEFGVPMLVYSTSHGDQDGCAARVEYHGLGISADRSSATGKEIEANLSKLLGDETIRQNIANMQLRFEEYRSRNAAVRLIEAKLNDVN